MLRISKNLRIIKVDENNLALEKLKLVVERNGSCHNAWTLVGYYGSLKSALHGLLHKTLFDLVENQLDIKQLIESIENLEKQIGE